MKVVTLNDHNLKDIDVAKVSYKTRAILLEGKKILVVNCANLYLLPGGAIYKTETPEEAIIRELKEETGTLYNEDELTKTLILHYYQEKYPSVDKKIINRLVTTEFFIGKYKGLDLSKTNRSERERQNNFSLELMDIPEFMKLTYVETDNPRKKFFDNENKEVFKVLTKIV